MIEEAWKKDKHMYNNRIILSLFVLRTTDSCECEICKEFNDLQTMIASEYLHLYKSLSC